MNIFTCTFVYTNTQTHTNRNTKLWVDQETSLLFYHKVFQVSFLCQDFPYGNSVRAKHSCTVSLRKEHHTGKLRTCKG